MAPLGDAAHVSGALALDLAENELDGSAVHRAVARATGDDDPTVWDRATALVWHDDTKVDGHLLKAGVRWHVLRHIHRSVRVGWWRALAGAELPAGTRVCWDGPEVWLDEVERRLAEQNWQSRRLDKWRRFAHLIARSCQRDDRPITTCGVDRETVAEDLGVHKDYVTKIIRWYREQQLLHIVMPGTRAPRLAVPVDELPEEAEARTVREARLEAAHAERRRVLQQWKSDRAAALHAGLTPPDVPDELGVFRQAEPLVERDDDRDLINVAQVYELLVPAAPDVRDAPPQPARARMVDEVARARQRRAQRRRAALRDVPTRPGVVAVRAAESAAGQDQTASGTPGRFSVDTESTTPSEFHQIGESVSKTRGVVDERRPSGGSYESGSGFAGGPNQSQRPTTRALRAAQRLLAGAEPSQGKPRGAVLPRQLCGADPRRVASRIAPFVLAGWTDEQLVAVIAHRGGTWSYVPPEVDNPTGFVLAALKRWGSPATLPLPEDVRDAVEQVEADNAAARQDREANGHRRAGRAAQLAREACDLCDESGYRPLDGGDQHVRCYHSPADRDEVEALRRAGDEGQDDELAPREAARAEIARVLKSDDPARQAVLAEAHRRRQERQAAQLANPNFVPRALRLQIQRGQRRF